MAATYWLMMMKNKIATILLLLLLCCCHYSPYYNYFYSNLTQRYSYASAFLVIVRNRNNNNNNNNNSYRQHHFLNNNNSNNNNHYHLSIRQQRHQFKATSNHENEIENNNNYLENDLISIRINTGGDDEDDNSASSRPKLYVVTASDGTVSPLCTHEDDNLTDLYLDPRCVNEETTIYDIKNNINEHLTTTIIKYYGEGWFAQRVVPSLGGGPGYGAEANSVWSIEENILDELIDDNVNIPILDMGIAHGEKARGGAI